jgi:xylulose-5-phosphate/fructose-6-phosphate phosphoketolase
MKPACLGFPVLLVSGPPGKALHPGGPGSIHEGGELGYSLSHAFGAAFDNPDLIVSVVIGDGEAETGPLATSWHSNTFLNPIRDGAVPPILHLNGFKIANPTLLSRITPGELENLFLGYGWLPYYVEGDDPEQMHSAMAATVEECICRIRTIQEVARSNNNPDRPRWPMTILRSPKGWAGPKEFKGHRIENSWRSHQVPIVDPQSDPERLQIVEEWLRSYHPERLFDETGALVTELRGLAPKGCVPYECQSPCEWQQIT